MNVVIESLSAFRGKKQVLKNIDLEIKNGSFTALLGENGCGKSTLVACLGGVLGYKGNVFIGTNELSQLSARERAKTLSIVPQLPNRAAVTVEELVSFGRLPYHSIGERATKDDFTAIEAAIDAMELTDIRNSRVDRISGGELKRAYIAMALAQNTSIMILDEPTAHIDRRSATHTLNLLRKAALENERTVLMVTHDISDAVNYADRIAIMTEGRLVVCDETQKILDGEYIETAFGLTRYKRDAWDI